MTTGRDAFPAWPPAPGGRSRVARLALALLGVVALSCSGANTKPASCVDHPPVVTFKSPPEDVELSGVVPIEIDTTPGCGVTQVELFAGAASIATFTSSPWKTEWDTTGFPTGALVLRAVVHDAAANSGEQARHVRVKHVCGDDVDCPPQVALVEPAEGQVVCGTTMVRALATDQHESPVVSFEADGAPIGSAGNPPYVVAWNTAGAANGPHVLAAVARDAAGHDARSEVHVVVDHAHPCGPQGPSVVLGCAGRGPEASCVTGEVVLCADVTDDGLVSGVRYAIDRGLLPGTPAPPRWELRWDSASAPEGTHELEAVATDDEGLTGEAIGTVLVDRTPPVLTFREPADGARVAGGAVSLAGEAADASGCGVERIEFEVVGAAAARFAGVGGAVAASWDASSAPSGSYTIRLSAVDRAGNPAVLERHVFVDRAPEIRLLAPSAVDPLAGLVEVHVAASDDLGPVTLALEIDGLPVPAAFDPTGRAGWDTTTFAHGDHLLTVAATDAAGQRSEVSETITLDQPLKASCRVLTCPAPAAACRCDARGCWDDDVGSAHGIVRVEAGATDDEPVDEVELRIDGVLAGTVLTPPFEFVWDTSAAADGAHAVTCVARNGRGIETAAEVAGGVSLDNCDRDHDGVAGSACGGSDCNDGRFSVGACTAAGLVCSGGACTCTGSAATDTCRLAGAGYCVGGTCAACTSTDQCGSGFACRAGKCEAACTGAVDCTGGEVCPTTDPRVCTSCSATDSNRSCGSGRYCGANGRCASCSANDPLRCGTTSSPAECRVCSGATPTCAGGSCACAGSGDTDSCVPVDGRVCLDGACVACTSTAQCGTGRACSNGRCVASCASDGACGTGRYCPGTDPRVCAACSLTDPAHCGTGSSAAGCRVCSGTTPVCSAGACACTGSGARDTCVQAGAGYCANGSCAPCTSTAQCGSGYACKAGICEVACTGGVDCTGGEVCPATDPRVCTTCSATDPNRSCGTGRYCAAGGRCASCSANDALHCGTAGSAAECSVCSGSTPTCLGGACACTGSGDTDSCVPVDGRVCLNDACVACTSTAQCGTGRACSNGRCVASCASDATCGTGRYCPGADPRVCAACSLTDPGHCGTGSSAAGCRVCAGTTPVCSAGACSCTGSGDTDSCIQAGAGYCANGTCTACTSTAQCGSGYACKAGRCEVACTSGADCAGGEVCPAVDPRVCTTCSATDSNRSCGIGRYCGADGHCASCSTSDALHCGTASSAAECRVCSGATPTCAGGACACTGSGDSDSCVPVDGRVCLNGTCVACTSTAQCGTGRACSNGRCVASCASDATCGTGRYCPGADPRVCAACSLTDPAHCGTGSSAAGCRVCSGTTPVCSAGSCACTGSGATDTCVQAGAGYCANGSCTACTGTAQCGSGYACKAGRCEVACTSGADCAGGEVCPAVDPRVCTTCSASDSNRSCGTGQYCGAGGRCAACSASDALHCGTASSPAECSVCSGATATCSAGRCQCTGSGDSDTCVAAGGLVCSAGSCVACTAASDCGTGRVCSSGRCRSTCSSDASCSAGEYCNAGACTPCSASDPLVCGDDTAPRGCRQCVGATPTCSAGVCGCSGSTDTDTCVPVDGRVCVAGSCAACTASTQCPTDGCCAPGSGRCLSFTPSSWTTPAVTGPPDARWGHTAIYDAANGRMIVYGGYLSSGDSPEVWSLPSPAAPDTWTLLFPSGAPPPDRHFHSAIYDAANRRMVIFGGIPHSTSTAYADVWALSLPSTGRPAWSQLAPTGTAPAGRYGHSAIYDALNRRMIVFGGGASPVTNETWALSLPVGGTPAWTKLSPAGSLPPVRYRHVSAYDPVRQQLVVYGGLGTGSSVARSDLWTLSLPATGTPTWTELVPSGTGPGSRMDIGGVFEPLFNRFIFYGGSAGPSSGWRTDVWSVALDGGPSLAWRRILWAGAGPTTSYFHTTIWEPDAGKMVLFSGGDSNALTNKTFVFTPDVCP